jgi:DNA-binding protein YbaB
MHPEPEPEPAVGRVTAELTELRLACDGEEGLTVTVDGFGRVVGVNVGPQLARRVHAERLGRLVVAAVNTARLAADEAAADRLSELNEDGTAWQDLDWPDWLRPARTADAAQDGPWPPDGRAAGEWTEE